MDATSFTYALVRTATGDETHAAIVIGGRPISLTECSARVYGRALEGEASSATCDKCRKAVA